MAERHQRKPHKRSFPRPVARPARTVVTVTSALLIVAGGTYAVPPTRAAIDDLTASFAGWVSGDDEQAPGTPLAPGNDAPDWPERFDNQAVVVLGAGNLGGLGDMLGERGPFPLLGVTARSVDSVELRYAQGPPVRETNVDGGFVILADAARPLTEPVAFDAAGRELGRADVSHIDLGYRCQQERGCSAP